MDNIFNNTQISSLYYILLMIFEIKKNLVSKIFSEKNIINRNQIPKTKERHCLKKKGCKTVRVILALFKYNINSSETIS